MNEGRPFFGCPAGDGRTWDGVGISGGGTRRPPASRRPCHCAGYISFEARRRATCSASCHLAAARKVAAPSEATSFRRGPLLKRVAPPTPGRDEGASERVAAFLAVASPPAPLLRLLRGSRTGQTKSAALGKGASSKAALLRRGPLFARVAPPSAWRSEVALEGASLS